MAVIGVEPTIFGIWTQHDYSVSFHRYGICENWTHALMSDSHPYAPFYQYPKKLFGKKRLELLILSALDFESSVYANSTTYRLVLKGVEPSFSDRKSDVLPLHHRTIIKTVDGIWTHKLLNKMFSVLPFELPLFHFTCNHSIFRIVPCYIKNVKPFYKNYFFFFIGIKIPIINQIKTQIQKSIILLPFSFLQTYLHTLLKQESRLYRWRN